MQRLPIIRHQWSRLFRCAGLCTQAGEWGTGAGKGGGAGGSIREAGGAFGKREAAQEEQYFRTLHSKLIQKLREDLQLDVKYHETQIRIHQEAIQRHMLKHTGKLPHFG